VGRETTSIQRAGDRLGDGDLPALAARDRGERREPLGLGNAWRSCCIPPGLALSRLEHLDARLYHDSALLLHCFSAERDGVADAELAQASGPLDRRRLQDVVQAVSGLDQQVALVAKLVRQPGA